MVQVVPANPRIFARFFDAVTKGVLDPKDRPDGKMFRLGPVVIENSRGQDSPSGCFLGARNH